MKTSSLGITFLLATAFVGCSADPEKANQRVSATEEPAPFCGYDPIDAGFNFTQLGTKWLVSDLTYSFMPDGGTLPVGHMFQGQRSKLFAALDARMPRQVWQREFARALQSWANQTNLNFRLSPDAGTDTGVQGLIRLGAIDMAASVAGMTYGPTSASYIYGGDVTINAQPVADLYSALLHETGHSLGLNHSNEHSIMTAVLSTNALQADDIAGIRSLYGARAQDAYDRVASNNDFAIASRISVSGNDTFSVRADLSSLADIDYYRVTAPAGAISMRVAVNANAISLLAPNVIVFNQNRQGLKAASAGYGGTVTADVPVTAGQDVYIMADGATSDEFGMGAYELKIEFSTANAKWIRNAYLDILNRPASAEEVKAVEKEFAAGVTRESKALAIVKSAEARRLRLAGYYQTFLRRTASPAELDYWISFRLNMTEQEVIAFFVSSDEYYNKAGNTNALWVTRLYTELLGRNVDAAGLQQWTSLLASGKTRQYVVNGFLTSNEYAQRNIAGMYTNLLRRPADAGGLSYWAPIFITKNAEEIVPQFLISQEYLNYALAH
jgi:hypothetical protein